MRRNNPSCYDNDRAVQAEELRLIESSLTPEPVSTGSDSAAPISQPSERTATSARHDLLERVTVPTPPDWVDLANAEIAELEDAAKSDP